MESWLGVIALFVVAGGSIVVIDALIIRQVRELGPPREPDSTS